MRKTGKIASFAVLFVCGSLFAGASAHAVSLGFTGAVTLQILSLPPVVLAGSGTAVVNGSGPAGHLTGLAIPASPFATTGFVLPITDPAVFPINGLAVTAHNGTGSFGGVGGAGFSGVMPILGVAKVCLFGSCGGSTNVANLVVPLSVVGAGGAATVTGPANVTVIGAPWTTGTAAVGALTEMGGVSPLSNTGAVSGNVTLVTPIFISTSIGSAAVIPAFAFTALHFVPEPGTIALLGCGVAALAAFGRSRMRG